jgi:RNA polymerase sigma factor (sigma-70 family)
VLAPSRPSAAETFLNSYPAIERIAAFVARRHHASADEADEFRSFVHERLIENDYGIIRKFEGRSTIDAFLATVIGHLFQDFRNREWGKWRPSAAARRAGRAAELFERCLVRDGLTFDQAFETVAAQLGGAMTRRESEELVARLPVRFRHRREGEGVLADLPAPDAADRGLLDEERVALWDRIMEVIAAERARLPPQDAAIVAMRFEDGRKISEIAAILQLDAKPLYEHVKKLIRQLRLTLEAAGIDAATVRHALEDEVKP